MNRISLQSLTVSQLVDRFTALALEQYEAERHGDTARSNRLFDEACGSKTSWPVEPAINVRPW
ncbi:MAG: hypothetical protein KIT48_05725 [Pseudolabrys sp.]|nr:hypothetical protein [Pseudolabrys sp.]